MDKTNTNDAAIEPRDPHAAWWMEHQRLAAEHHNRYLVRAEEANADDERRYRRLDELEDLLRNTPVTTFEGSRIQLMVLALAIEDGLRHDDLKGVLGNLSCFMNDIERALERHQLKEQAQRWCWKRGSRMSPHGPVTPARRPTRKRSRALSTRPGNEMRTAVSRKQSSAVEARQRRRSIPHRPGFDPSRSAPGGPKDQGRRVAGRGRSTRNARANLRQTKRWAVVGEDGTRASHPRKSLSTLPGAAGARRAAPSRGA
jgi:hypothetical protein